MASSQLPATESNSDPTSTADNLRRLLLYEVLLEEYETHCALKENENDSSTLAAQEIEIPQEPRDQPRLLKNDVVRIKQRGAAFSTQRETYSDENTRAEFEDKYNGELVLTVLSLIVRAQKKASENKFEALRTKYDEKLKNHLGKRSESKSKEEYDAIVEKAVIADIQGVVDDYREQYRKERMETDGLEKPGDRAEVDQSAEQFAFQSVIKEEQSAADKRDPTTSEEDNARNNPISQEDPASTPETPSVHDALPKNSAKRGAPAGVQPPKEVDRARKAKRLDASTRRSALCLSGGGIRSATFNLGILQGLARHGLLAQFDYLSTVSGGGFAGSFLTAWMHRAGTTEVLTQLTDPPQSPLVTEPHPIDHLRVFGNYLSLRPGILRADTWTLIATVLRNLLLTWLVFVPFLLIMLMAPRVWATVLAKQYLALLWLGIVSGWVTLAYTAHALSKQNSEIRSVSNYKSDEGPFLLCCLAPAIFSAMCFASYWASLDPGAQAATTWWDFVKLMLLLVAPPWIVGYFLRQLQKIAPQLRAGVGYLERRKELFRKLAAAMKRHLRRILRFVSALALILLSQLIAGCLLYVVAVNLLPSYVEHPRLYATFAVPLLMLVLALACTLIAGFNSGFTKDDDQEWWARFSAWFLIVVLSWSAAHLLVFYGPSLVLSLGDTFRELWQKGLWTREFLEALAKWLRS